MLDWLNSFLTLNGVSWISDTMSKYSAWFTEIQSRYPGTTGQSWATQQAYYNAMASYGEYQIFMSVLAMLAFILCATMFYKFASSFMGFWRTR